MSVEILFADHIAKIKRRFVIQAIHRILLHAALISLTLAAIFCILALVGIPVYPFSAAWYWVPIGISLSAAIFIGYATRSNLLNRLIDIDRRLNLQDRLSTAYEYLILKKKTDFSDLLMKDAAAKLHQFTPQQLMPAKFSGLHLGVVILLIINLLLYSITVLTSDNKLTRQDLKKIENAGELLKDYTISRVDHPAGRTSQSKPAYSKPLEQFSRTFNDPAVPFKQRLAALDRFLKEVQGEQTRLANELAERLDSAVVKELPVPKIPDVTKLSSSQLEKLKAFLNSALNNRMPDSISRHIESLQELESIETLLYRIIENLPDDRLVSGDSAGSDDDTRQPTQSAETLETSPANTIRPHPDRQLSGHRRNTADRNAPLGFEELQGDGDDRPEGMGQPDGHSASAGTAKSKAEYPSSHPLAKAPGAGIQDKMTPSAAQSYLVHIRALTDIGEARLKEEAIFQTYRKEVESILQKEDIPINYREYIKNYFLSIGMDTEKNVHESK